MRSNPQFGDDRGLGGAAFHEHQGLTLVPRRGGIYSMIIQLRENIEVNLRGTPHRLIPGMYIYTGSALGRSSNLRTRILRHLSVGKKVHWHIDQITNSRQASVLCVVFSETSQKGECAVNQSIAEVARCKVPVPGFGSSDCRSGCVSHLLFLEEKEIVVKIVEAFKNQGLRPKVLEIEREKGQADM